MEIRTRSDLAVAGGIFCAVAGSLLGGLVVAVTAFIRGGPWTPLQIVGLFPMGLIFAVVPAASFGFVVGSVGGWYLAARFAKAASFGRVVLEGAGAGALLGATFPLVMGILGWGPFANLVGSLPLATGIGMVCGVGFAVFIRRFGRSASRSA